MFSLRRLDWAIFISQNALDQNRRTYLSRNGDVIFGPRYMSYRPRYGAAREDLFLLSDGGKQRKPLPEFMITINSEGVGMTMLEPR